MSIFQEISQALQNGHTKKTTELLRQALNAGADPQELLDKGLLDGITAIGRRFDQNEAFVPEVMLAAKAMNAGLELLEPELAKAGRKRLGTAVVGTVKGDFHDIGKNLVIMMLKCVGFDVRDIGVDAPAELFADTAEKAGADIICISSLMKAAMPQMEAVLDVLKKRGIREKYIVMVGGAPVSESYARQIGADYYTPDAATAARVAKQAMTRE